MYFGISILILICMICALSTYLNLCRKPSAIQKVRCLSLEEKSQLLSSLTSPMGFAYDKKQDIFVSRINAWQRPYGYSKFFDYSAPFFQMALDCEPIYFNYDGKTWMIELWKGQYGINTGCEVGIYKTDAILPLAERRNAHFYAVKDEEMLPIRITFQKENQILFKLSKRHWWLAGFSMGMFSEPDELQMTISITFPNSEMMHIFMDSLKENGHCWDIMCMNNQTVIFRFHTPTAIQPRQVFKIRCAISQWKNRLLCKLYRRVTRPFSRSVDRLLYLYYFLPFAFRKIIAIQKPKRKRKKLA